MRFAKKLLYFLFDIYVSLFTYIPTRLGVLLRYIAYKPLFKKTDGFFEIEFGVTIRGFKNISFGKKISLRKNSYIYANDGIVVIGNNFSMNSNSQIGANGGG